MLLDWMTDKGRRQWVYKEFKGKHCRMQKKRHRYKYTCIIDTCHTGTCLKSVCLSHRYLYYRYLYYMYLYYRYLYHEYLYTTGTCVTGTRVIFTDVALQNSNLFSGPKCHYSERLVKKSAVQDTVQVCGTIIFFLSFKSDPSYYDCCNDSYCNYYHYCCYYHCYHCHCYYFFVANTHGHAQKETHT